MYELFYYFYEYLKLKNVVENRWCCVFKFKMKKLGFGF